MGDSRPRLSGRAQLDGVLLVLEKSGASLRRTAGGGCPHVAGGGSLARAGTLVPTLPLLRELGVLGFGFFQDGDVRVGIFPQCEEILVGSAGLGRVAGQCVGSADLQVS